MFIHTYHFTGNNYDFVARYIAVYSYNYIPVYREWWWSYFWCSKSEANQILSIVSRKYKLPTIDNNIMIFFFVYATQKLYIYFPLIFIMNLRYWAYMEVPQESSSAVQTPLIFIAGLHSWCMLCIYTCSYTQCHARHRLTCTYELAQFFFIARVAWTSDVLALP